MSKDIKSIPELRFPDFQNEGEWSLKSLEEVANVVASGDLDKDSFSQEKTDLHTFPIYSNSVSYEGLYGYNTYSKYPPNSVTITARGTLGIAFVRNTEFVGIGRLLIASDLEGTDPVFLKENWNHFAKVPLENGGIPQLTAVKAKRISLLYPKIDEQQKIASCLSSLDELLAAHNDKLKALKDHKKGLMQNLFPQEGETVPKVRFKEFEKDGEWKATTVEDNCLVKGRIGYRGYTKQDLVKEGEGVLVLGGKNIQNHLIDLSAPTYLSWEKYYESPEIMVEMNHIIFSQRGTLGDCAIIDKEIGKATINPSMVLLRDITCNPKFLYYILIGDRVQSEVSRNSTSSAVPMLSQKQIREFSFLIPLPSEQEKIASSLSALDELLIAQQMKIGQLQEHKKGLMQGLFPKIKLT